MQNVIFDVEADGLLDEVTKLHCLVLRDLDTNEVLSCTDDSPDYASIREGLEVLKGASRIYGHNILRYDLPVLRKLYPDFDVRYEKGRIFDTLVMTRLAYAHIRDSDYTRAAKGKLPAKLIGSHGLEAWGHRLGVYKGEYTEWCKANGIEDPWTHWRPEMQAYCEQDTEVNRAVIQMLRASDIPSEALFAELELAAYLSQQERNGWPFDMEVAAELHAELSQRKHELEQELKGLFGSWYVPVKEFTPKVNNRKLGYVAGAPVTQIKLVEFNPASRNHIADRLQKVYGWQPTVFTPSGQPQVDESTLAGLTFPGVDKLQEYLLVDKRLGQLTNGKEAWLNHATKSGWEGGRLTGMPHVHHSIGNVAVTHRHRHSHPNVGQVPSVEAAYGVQCRSCWTVPPGWKLVGADASGLELRCLAHYVARWDGGEYGEAILNGDKEKGTDIHSMNAKALGLSRSDAKTWIYAWLYGAGNPKLGSISHPEADEATQAKIGERQKRRFLKALPALKYLQDAVRKAAKNDGYVRLPDKRRAYIRHQHAALNTLLQGAGAIICKHWIVEFNRRLMERFDTPHGGGWEYAWAAVGWIHDEVQVAVREEYAEEVATILVESIRAMTEKFSWRVPLDGEAQIGDNWSMTH